MSDGMRGQRWWALVIAVMAVGLGWCACPAPSVAGEKAYSAVLINNFMGNAWRPLMERSIQLLIDKPPLQGRIRSLRIINTENSAAAENAAIASVTLDKPDMILLIAASPTASNQAVQQACDAGIVVVSFDGIVTAPCAWKLALDFEGMGEAEARWTVGQIGGKGKVFVDLGLAGVPSALDCAKGVNAVLSKHPDIQVITYYGGFSPGEEQAQVATLLAAHPDVKAIVTHAYGSYALQALQDAGLKPVPVTGFAYSESILRCEKENVPCLLRSSPTWISGEAARLAVDVLDGKHAGPPGFVLLHAPWVTNVAMGDADSGSDPVLPLKDVAGDLQPGIMLPLSPSWAKLDLNDAMKPPTLQ